MKKFLISLMLFFPLLSFASFDVNLGFGSKGPEVAVLQQFLKDQGYFNYEITGNFFGITKKAVQDYQKANSIINTGFFGPLTRAQANTIVDIKISKFEISTSTPAVDQIFNEQERFSTQPFPIIKSVVDDTSVSTTTTIVVENKCDSADENSFVWFGQSKEIGQFTAEKISTTTAKINIPHTIKNSKNLNVSIQIFYWITDIIPGQPVDMSSVVSDKLPIMVELSEEYLGHNIAFQLLYSYECIKPLMSVDYLKAENSIKFIDF